MTSTEQFERQNQCLELSSGGATLASIVIAIIAIIVPFKDQYLAYNNILSFLKIIFSFSITCSILAMFSHLLIESKEHVSDFLFYLSIISLIASLFFLVPLVFLYL